MYGGVVPEVAARSHIEVMIPVIQEALDKAFPGLNQVNQWEQVDAITVVNGPGLGGSLLIGTLTARTLALTKNKPLYAVHHALGHIYANFIDWTTGDWRHKTGDWQEPVFPPHPRVRTSCLQHNAQGCMLFDVII
jgi:tRNA A37 threonylcarbamoyltransferase TsaD